MQVNQLAQAKAKAMFAAIHQAVREGASEDVINRLIDEADEFCIAHGLPCF